ncbi:MAG TPA: YbdK family carboxylate-amine ligase [Ideonella sp.]|nr:YbdK family carboxylate-amine ligase [Ideonella sp.]
MSLEPFASSEALSLGVELELQLVNRHDYDLTPASPDLMRLVGKAKIPGSIVPEMTASMIEMSTNVCRSHAEVLSQLSVTRDVLVDAADRLNVGICGGGTHPFQHWSERRIYDKPRFKQISELYGYLAKQFTIFGQHIHIGCASADEALWLLHAMSRYIPHFIALSASSPFVQGTDTSFDSARLNSVFAFPMSGRAPFVTRWEDFETYFAKMTRTGVINSMKDFYWDIRPKPEYGTIEIRVLDTPLTIERAAALAAYAQCLARWLLAERPFQPAEDDYLVYTFNRFQACRFGLEGTLVDPGTAEHRLLAEDIVDTLARLAPHAAALDCSGALQQLGTDVVERRNDASWVRETARREKPLGEVVRRQCELWRRT